jgi:hypothetical protein
MACILRQVLCLVHCYRYWVLQERREVFTKPKGKISLERLTSRHEDNIKETGFGSVVWIHLAQDRVHWQDLVSTVMNI